MSSKLIPGVLHTSSVIILGFNRRGIPRKKFTPFDKSLGKFSVSTKLPLLDVDSYVVIEKDEDTINNNINYKLGNIQVIIGKVGDYDAEYTYLKYVYNISYKKNKDILLELDLNLDLTSKNRVDLQHLDSITIDPFGCKDIDDSLSYRKINTISYEIGVHIADVSSYLIENTNLDIKYLNRGTSTYLVKEVINMLDDEFTNECSLFENKTKRTFSIIFTFTNDILTDTIFVKSLIKVRRNYSYEEAEMLKNKDETVKNLYNIGNILYNKYTSINNTKYDTHKLVEVFMLLANITVARKLAIYTPDNCLLRSCPDNSININQEINQEINQGKDFKMLLNSIKTQQFKAAQYISNSNSSMHYMLNEQYYTHFTSPIRRYADITVHRQLYKLICNENINLNNNICNILNLRSKNSKSAERDSKLLEIIYDIYKRDSIFISYGYIAGFDTDSINLVKIYIPQFDIIVDSKIYDNKLKNIVKSNVNSNKIVITNKDKDLVLTLLDKVQLKIVVSIKESKLRKKLLTVITNPDILQHIKL